MRSRRKKTADEVMGRRPVTAWPPTGTHCSDCGEPQYATPHGHVCVNGHGGAPPLEATRTTVPSVSPTETRPIVLWQEDDATTRDPLHETVERAWLRFFGEKLDTSKAVHVDDLGDEILHRMPNGALAVLSYPGNNRILGPASMLPLRDRKSEAAALTGKVARPRIRLVPTASAPLVEISTWPVPESTNVEGAIVKLSPTIKASERERYDMGAAVRELRERGALAVLPAPRIVPDGGGSSKRAEAMRRAPNPHELIRAWFTTAPGLTDSQIEESIARAGETYDAANATGR